MARSAHDRRTLAHVRGDVVHLRETVGDEAAAHQQILGGVPADRELTEHGDLCSRRLRLAQRLDDPVGVGAKRPHRGIELAEGDGEL